MLKLVTQEIMLDGLEAKNGYDRVSVSRKVVRVADPVKVSGGLKKQDATIADLTCVA